VESCQGAESTTTLNQTYSARPADPWIGESGVYCEYYSVALQSVQNSLLDDRDGRVYSISFTNCKLNAGLVTSDASAILSEEMVILPLKNSTLFYNNNNRNYFLESKSLRWKL